MDYRQQEGAASSWRRARRVTINNDRAAVPSIAFHEEDIVQFGGNEFRTPLASFVEGDFDPAAEIPLVNPVTGALTGGVATHSDLYVILHSLYIQLAAERDAGA